MSQEDSLLRLLSDGLPHSTPEILEVVYGNNHLGLARVGARVHGLKQKGFEIQGRRDLERSSIYWYQLVKKPSNGELFKFKTDPLGRKVAHE